MIPNTATGLTPADALQIAKQVARRYAWGRPDLDDLTQEAAVAAVKMIEKRPDIHAGYVAGVARHQVLDIIGRGRPYLTTEGGRGANDVYRHEATTGLTEHVDEEGEQSLIVTEHGYEVVEWRTLRADILAAIDALPTLDGKTTRMVRLMLALGLTPQEAAVRLGLTRDQGKDRWAKARPRLRKSLAHMKEYVAA